nr:stage III sporulation protein AE [uncultured Butyricicoccus sp.]
MKWQKRLCRWGRWMICLAGCIALCIGLAGAADQTEQAARAEAQTQSDVLTDALPHDAAQRMDGVTLDGGVGQAAAQLLDNTVQNGQSAWLSALSSLGKLLVVAVVCGLLQSARAFAGGNELPVVTMAGALGMTGVFLSDLSGMMTLCQDTLHEVSTFSKAMLPVMAGAVTMTGAPTAATVLQGVTMFSFDLLVRFLTGVLLPGVGVYIAIVTVNTAVGGGLLGQLAGFIKWLITGSMKLTLTVFIAYLTISGVIGGSADALAVKTAKFAVSGSVPVVGGIISDAAESMLAGAVLIRNTVGVMGMLCIAALCVVPFVKVGCNYLLFKAGAAVLTPVCGNALSGLVAGLSDSMGLMLGMLGTCSAILFFELVFSVTLVNPI